MPDELDDWNLYGPTSLQWNTTPHDMQTHLPLVDGDTKQFAELSSRHSANEPSEERSWNQTVLSSFTFEVVSKVRMSE